MSDTPPRSFREPEFTGCEIVVPLPDPRRPSLAREITGQVEQWFGRGGIVYDGEARQFGKTAWAEHVQAGRDQAPDAGAIRYETPEDQHRRAAAHARELRRLRTPGEVVCMGTARYGFRRYLVGDAEPRGAETTFPLLALPLRWEGDDS